MSVQREWPLRSIARERNREALVTAASDFLLLGSYRECSVSSLAKRAGLSTGAVYSIFGSKAELFLALLQRSTSMPAMSEVLARPASVIDAVETYARLWATTANDPEARRLWEVTLEIQLAALHDPPLRQRLVDAQAYERSQTAAELEALAVLCGDAFVVPSLEVADALLGTLKGLSEAVVFAATPADPDGYAAAARRLLSGTLRSG